MLRLIFAVLFLHIGVASTTDDNRIIGGRPATDGEFPYQLSLRRLPSTRHFCGGSLITPGHVLTAAHCMYYMWGGELPPMVVRVVAGQLNLTLTPGSLYRDVVKITIHEGYERVSMSNDVAILDLSKPFELNPTIVFVIPLRRTPVNSGSCVVSGWGSEKFEWNNVSEILLTAEVDIIGRKKCADLYGNGTIVDSMLCAGVENGERDACQGDSGGPLVCDGVLTGVVSTGKGCGNPQYPGVYANIPHLLPWIQKHTNLIPQTSALESDQFKTTTTQLEEIEIMNAFVRFLESFRRNSATKPNLAYVAITLCSVLLFSIK